jgi:hypothetical protein
MSKFTNCLNIHNLSNKLPEQVVADITNGNTKSLVNHIAILKKEQVAIETKFEEAKNNNIKEALKATPAGSYVNQDNDPTNQLNNFKVTGLNKVRKNLVQRMGSVLNVLKSHFVNGLTTNDQKVLNEFTKEGGFSQQFTEVFDSIHKTTDNLYFRFKDFIQYFPHTEGTVDEVLKSAMSSVSFEWLHTEAKLALGQTEESLKRMFGMSKDETVPDAMRTALIDLGLNRDILADQLGRTILERINIEAITNGDRVAYSTDTAKLIRSLGYMSLATMENMTYSDGKPIIKRQEVYNKAIDALKEGDILEYDDIFYDPSDEQRALDNDPLNDEHAGKKGKPARTYIKLNTDRLNANGLGRHDIHSDLEEAKALLHDAPEAFNSIFGDTPTAKAVSWVKIKISNAVGKFGKANKLQTKNLQKNADVGYVKSIPVMDVFTALTGSALDMVVGVQNMDGKLDLRNKSVEGSNRGIQRDLDAIAEYRRFEEIQNEAEGTAGKNRTFYINSRFQAQHRMLHTGLSGQLSKTVRNLFTPEAFNIEFDPKTDKATDEAFLQSIALSFDIETIKSGGKVNQLDLLKKKLKNEKIANAIKAIQAFHKTGSMTEEQQMIIALGVKETKAKVHGLKGLVEYARYDSYKKDKSPDKGLFTTDMYDENDGVSNGVVFAALMFIPDSAVNTPEKAQELLAIAAMGGVSVDRRATTPNLDKLIAQKNLNDAYQRMGQQWAITEQRMKLELKQASEDTTAKVSDRAKALNQYNKFLAIESLLGRFTESTNADGNIVNDGVVNKLIRSLSKPRTMQTVYRAGIAKQNEILATENIISDGIYASLERLIQRIESLSDNDKHLASEHMIIHTELIELFNTVKTLSNDATGLTVSKYMTDGLLDPVKLKAFKLNKEQINNIVKSTRDTYGEAMKQAIDSVFSHIIAASKPFVTLMERAASTYNLVLKAKVEAAIKAKDTRIINEYKKAVTDLEAAVAATTDKVEKARLRKNTKIPHQQSLQQQLGQLTIEELKEITDSIAHLIPKIETPVSTENDRSYLYLAKSGSVRENSKMGNEGDSTDPHVQQEYKGKTPRNNGYVTTIPYLASIGASGFVKAVQMIDAMHANHAMSIEGVDLLSIHDGFVHGIKDSKTIADSINQYMKDTLFGTVDKPAYSFGEAFMNMHNEMTQNASLTDVLLKNDISMADVIAMYLTDGVINSDTYDITYEKLGLKKDALQLKTNDQALHSIIGLKENMTAEEQSVFLQDLHKRIDDKAKNMAEQITRNKQILGDAVTRIAQYPHNGIGIEDMNSVNTTSKVFGVDRDSVLKIAGTNANAIIDDSVRMNDMGVFGSSATDVSTDPDGYVNPDAHAQTIDSQNVTEVFDSILTLDAQAAAASVQNSQEHVADIRRILNTIVSKVMKPVTFYMAQYAQQNDETAGAHYNNTIWIQRQQVRQPASGMLGQGIRMSAAVVYAHEMIHHITRFGLKNNANLQKQVYDLYDFTRESLEAAYGANAFKVFMNDPNADLNDPANAYEIIAAKTRWNYMFNPEQSSNQTHAGLDEFLAFGMTDENFKREVASLAINQKLLAKRKTIFNVFEKNIQTTMVNLFNMITDFVQHVFHKQNHSVLVGQEIENLVSALAKVDAQNKNTLLSALAYAEEKATVFGLNMDEKIKTIASKAMNTTQMGKAITTLKQLPELDNMISHRLRVAMLHYKDQEQGFFSALWTEAKGTTERLRDLHGLQARRQLLIDTAKEEASANAATVSREWFGKELSPIEKTALTKVVLKGDISLLNGIVSFDAIKGFIESPTQREAHIQSLLGQIRTLINSVTANPKEQQEYMNWFEGGINDLAYGMVTGEGFVEGKTYVNAHNLAVMSHSRYANTLVNTPIFNNLVGLLDQLASVASLRHASNRDKQAVVSLMNSHPEAIEKVLGYHQLLKKQAADELFEGSQALMEKGYVKTILNSRIQFEQGTLADEQAFADRGFKRHAMPFTRDSSIDPVTDKIYMYISHNGTINDYQSGIFSLTRNKSKGAGEFDIQKQIGNVVNPAFVANANNAIALANMEAIAEGMLQSAARTKSPTSSNTMTPKFDTRGKMTGFRYIASEQTKDTVLQQFSEFDSVLGALASQMIDKKNTPIINAEVVVALREMWDKEKDEYHEAYVKIGPHSPIKRYRDIYNNLPEKTKIHILSEWGENAMMVSQDVVDLAFGQRKYSITEMFDKDISDRNIFERLMIEGLTFALGFHNPLVKDELESVKGRAVTRAKTIEDFMIQLTKLAKGNVIVRSVRVTWGNHVSNIRYLKSKGVPLRTIFKYQREALTSALQYQADNSKLQALLVNYDVTEASHTINAATKKVMLTNISRQIIRLQHQLANNPSTAMIKAGLLPSIVDDINTTETKAPHKFGIDKAIDTGLSKLSPAVERFGRAVFMTEDTEGFKMANNAVKMTDYIGRYVLYKHYTAKGMVHTEAVSRVSDEFINFAPPTHRMLEYANNLGLVWYTKYQIRVLKHIKNVITDHPFSTLATFIIGSTTSHNNIVNTIPFVTKNAGALVGNPLSTGIDSIDGILPVHGIATILGG